MFTRNMKIKNFSQQIYHLTAKIPRGQVVSYGQIAKTLGRPHACRAVGNALNKNPYATKVPCHRVIRSSGEVGGFAFGTKKKVAMLKKENIIIKNNKINLRQYLYKVQNLKIN